MALTDILSIGLATLVLAVATHFVVFWVARTMYPPAPAPPPVPQPVTQPPSQPPQQTFTEPDLKQQQDVVLPTYETSVPMEATRQEGDNGLLDMRGPPA